jgi:hypothetical protein
MGTDLVDQFTGSGHIHAEVMSCTDMTGSMSLSVGLPTV